jgi:hypothetical protein
LLALVPLTIGILVAIKLVFAMLDDIEQMERVIVPGERDLQLDAGEHVLYAESRSVVDGVSYQTGSVSLRCGVRDAAGAEVALDTPNGSTSYAIGGYAGQSMAELHVATAGTYRLTCTGGPAVVAVGHGIGARLVSVVVVAFAGFGLAVLVVVLVRRRRRKPPVVVWPVV